MSPKEDNLIWIDLEMTGLDTMSDHIIEIATVVTDSQLNIIEEGPELVIHQPDEVLNAMDDWNTNQHSKSGLIARIQESTMTASEAETETLAFLRKHLPAKTSPMCGNTICQDRRFMAREMPILEAFFHYRNYDVSSVKEMCRRWYPETFTTIKKVMSHRALGDVIDSINELKHYRQRYFRAPEELGEV